MNTDYFEKVFGKAVDENSKESSVTESEPEVEICEAESDPIAETKEQQELVEIPDVQPEQNAEISQNNEETVCDGTCTEDSVVYEEGMTTEVYGEGESIDETVILEKNESDGDNGTDLSVLTEKLASMEDLINAIYTKLETERMSSQKKDETIASMSKELQQYKDGMYSRLFKPILLDLAFLREDLRKTLKAYEKKEEESFSKEKILNLIQGYIYDTSDLLEKYDVCIYETEPGEKFVPLRHKIIKTVDCTEEEQNGVIAEVLSNGYELDEKVIAPERVYVYKTIINNKTEDNGGNENV